MQIRNSGQQSINANSALCQESSKTHREKTKARLATTGKVAGAVAVVAGTIYALVRCMSDAEAENCDHPFEVEDCDMRCGNCGNTDKNTLWDEGDTIYCSKCVHRTVTNAGEDEVVECPCCHRMRDEKALYCRWCNDSTWEAAVSRRNLKKPMKY